MSGGSSANSFSGGLRTIDGSVAGVFSIDPRRKRLTRRSGTGAAMTVAIYVFAAICHRHGHHRWLNGQGRDHDPRMEKSNIGAQRTRLLECVIVAFVACVLRRVTAL
jgi:hypothetical protein